MDVQGSTRMSVERGFFLSTMNPRWKTDAWPSTEIQAGDLQSAKATNFLRGRHVYLPSAKHQKSETRKELKDIVDSGPGLYTYHITNLTGDPKLLMSRTHSNFPVLSVLRLD